MLEFIKLLHDALHVDSTWAFVLILSVFGAILFGGVGLLFDMGYKNSLEDAGPVSSSSISSSTLVTAKTGILEPLEHKRTTPEKPVESGDMSAISVWNTSLVRDEAGNKLKINIELKNSGNYGTSAHITFKLLDNSVVTSAVNSIIPNQLYFAPNQSVNLELPLNITKDGYASYITGSHTFEIVIEAEYDNGNKHSTYLFKGRLNPETSRINTIQSQMKK